MINQEELLLGIDEAGRGPLAGPVVAAGVILCPKNHIDGLADSKLLSEKKRASLFLEIKHKARFVTIACVEAKIIDQVNILQATLLAMGEVLKQAVTRHPAIYAVIDGNQTVKKLSYIPQQAIIKGDSTVHAIMAASIVAKVHRDRLMQEFDKTYPNYGFAQHKGYPTALHRTAIAQFGPCPIHRMSFAPLKSELL